MAAILRPQLIEKPLSASTTFIFLLFNVNDTTSTSEKSSMLYSILVQWIQCHDFCTISITLLKRLHFEYGSFSKSFVWYTKLVVFFFERSSKHNIRLKSHSFGDWVRYELCEVCRKESFHLIAYLLSLFHPILSRCQTVLYDDAKCHAKKKKINKEKLRVIYTTHIWNCITLTVRVHLFDHYLYRICDACAVILISLYYPHTLVHARCIGIKSQWNSCCEHCVYKECETQWLSHTAHSGTAQHSIADSTNQWHTGEFFFSSSVIRLLQFHSVMELIQTEMLALTAREHLFSRYALISHFHLHSIKLAFTKCSTWNRHKRQKQQQQQKNTSINIKIALSSQAVYSLVLFFFGLFINVCYNSLDL